MSTTTVDVVLSWSREGSGATAVLEQQGDAWTEIARTVGTEYVVRGVDTGRAHVFAAAAVLEDGDLVPDDEWEKLRFAGTADSATPARPSTPSGFAVAQDGPNLTARWDAATDGVTASWELRIGSTWEDGRLVAEGLTGSPYTWAWESSGAQTIHLKAVDRLGRACLIAAESDVTIAALDTYVTDGSTDEAGGGFAGTKTHVEVDTGVLRLTALGKFGAETDPFGSYEGVGCFARYWPEGTYESSTINLGQVEPQRVELDLGAEQPTDAALPFGAYRVSVFGRRQSPEGDYFALGTRSAAAKRSWRGSPLRPVDMDVEIDTSPTNAGAWDGWRRYVPGTYSFWRVRIRLTLRGDGFRFTRVPTFVIRRRLLNLKDEGTVALPGGAPVTVTFATAFVNTPKVVAGLAAANAILGPKIVVTNKSATQFDIEMFSNAGVSLAGSLDWHALGT